jgi:hypothetical protein
LGAVSFLIQTPDLVVLGKWLLLNTSAKTLPIIDPEYFIIAVVVCDLGLL